MQKLLSIFMLFGSAIALGQSTCPTDPTQIAMEISKRFTFQRTAISQSKGLITFQDDSGRIASVYRIASLQNGVLYTDMNGQILNNPKNLSVKGAYYHITSDLNRTSSDRQAIELTFENYDITYNGPLAGNPNILTYQLHPKGKFKGRFKNGTKLQINRKTCMPVEVKGDVFTGEVGIRLSLDVTFRSIKGMAIPYKTDVRGNVVIIPYHMRVTNLYKESDIILSDDSGSSLAAASESSKK